MEDFKPLDPDKYLKRFENEHLDLPKEQLEESLEHLGKPLKNIEYKDQDTVEVEHKDIKFKFSYSLPDQESKNGIEIYVANARERISFPAAHVDPNNWRKIDSLVFSVDDKEIDMFSILPKQYKILFCPSHEAFHGAVSETFQEIYILGDIASTRSLIILLHEIGHLFDDKHLSELHTPTGVQEKNNADLAETIRQERVATAFAFKVLKPFFKDVTLKRDVMNYLKHYALARYYKTELQTLDLRREAEEYIVFNSYLSWKKTNAYKKWLEDEKIAETDPEKFNKWLEWIEKTGYDYQKDLEELD